MKTFKEFMSERVVNLFDDKDKLKYADEIWTKLQKSYEPIGGIRGSGFTSKEDMIKNIKLWKVVRRGDEITAGRMHKDSKGVRKSVAAFTDGTPQGKDDLVMLIKGDLKVSVVEVSGGLIKFIKRRIPEVYNKFRVPSSKVSKIIGKEVKIIDEYTYSRKIGGTDTEKVLLGTPNKFH